MREIRYDQLQESVFHEQLDNGLHIYIMPKPEFHQAYATFTAKYGSIDREFVIPGDTKPTVVPDGIAHFLEHKMFEEEHGDVFQEFAKYGASANAYTTFDMTTYLFSATDHLYENLQILVDFVQRTHLTDENVEKEKGIIGQEIQMYDDNPDWRSYFGVLQGLFKEHPVRIDIAGTIDSIAKITKETLNDCYKTFYHPSNMLLFVVGPFDPPKVVDLVAKNQSAKQFQPQAEIQRIYPQEPLEAANPRMEVHLSVSIPRCLFGFKEVNPGVTGRSLLERELSTAVGFDTLFSRSAELFNRLYNAGLIDKGFTWEYEVNKDYGFSVIGGNSKDPDRLMSIINAEVAKVRQEGVPRDAFELSRKKMIGKFLEGMDSPRYIARNFTSYRFKDADFFESVSVLEQLTHEQVNRRLAEHFEPKAQTVSLVLPNS
ncbi:EF-P 5-aminopentanol modification-associated protein YfmH [Effusibacillus lacus]|uniref:Zinc protease n=1 Tax=Effusibacillus lacus TaxID=1348429 RepID=A0A292YBX0_9BACL|nr:pitrilysin family protein [Effusibacillus lacus]TCS74730.1 putative Zn-dependent peptidase [Effusibacillus lacus]GAX88542.1 zinc protease [Effusibacillus lacus]